MYIYLTNWEGRCRCSVFITVSTYPLSGMKGRSQELRNSARTIVPVLSDIRPVPHDIVPYHSTSPLIPGGTGVFRKEIIPVQHVDGSLWSPWSVGFVLLNFLLQRLDAAPAPEIQASLPGAHKPQSTCSSNP